MSYQFSERSLRNLQGVHPDLVRVVHRAIELTPIDFVVTEGLRTRERQAELFAAGASKTMNSRHLGGFAIDVAALVGRQVRWDAGLYYQIAGSFQQASKQLSVPIRWGGAWARLDSTNRTPERLVLDYAAAQKAKGNPAFIDSPHFELPATVYS